MTRTQWHTIHEIIGAAMEVHSIMGSGLLDALYQEALSVELYQRDIPFEREKDIDTFYKGVKLNKAFKVDFMVEDILVEVKSVEQINSAHRAQLFNYMRLTKTGIGVLINFGEQRLRCERYMFNPDENDFILLTSKNITEHLSSYY